MHDFFTDASPIRRVHRERAMRLMRTATGRVRVTA